MTSADAQAFKRACSCFGLGRYFYDFPATWVDLDQKGQPVKPPVLSSWALPENWRKDLRPSSRKGEAKPEVHGKGSQRCKWVAIDAEYKNSMEDLLKLQYHLIQDGVEPALEMSKRGGHLWIFLAKPLLAKECRIYIHDLALKLGVPVKGSGLADGIEVFPKHDAIGAGEFGNAIRGPLGIHRGASRRFWFYGADYTLEDQIAYLNRLRKVTEEELRKFIAGRARPEPEFSPRPQRNIRTTRQEGTARSGFRILEHVGTVRKISRNYVARCPSCADSGHDRSGDNLAILIADPCFYKCWAGCTKEMIRAAVGQPIPIRRP